MGLQVMLGARYLWGRKLRTVLTTLAIVFGTLLIFGMNTMLPTMVKAFQSNILAASGQVDVTITHNTGEAFSSSVLTRVRGIAGVRASAGSLSRAINIPDGYYGRAKVSALTLSGIDPKAAPMLRSYAVKEGRFLRPSDTTAAVITTSLADELGLKLGDELPLPTTEGTVKVKIVGLLPARTLPGNEEVLVTLYQAQKWFDLPDRINTIEADLNTTDPAQRAAIERAIEATVGKGYTLGGLSAGTEIMASIRTGQMALNLFGFLALVMGGFIIFNTFRTIVAERRHDIGMLRAIGASRRTIVGLILIEGVLQGVVGAGIGIFLGYLLSLSMFTWMAPLLQQFIHVEAGLPIVQPSLVVGTIALGIGVTLVAGLPPALSASRTTPLEALRPPVAQTSRRSAHVGAIIGAVLIVLAVLALISGTISLTALGGLMFLVGIVLVAPVLVRPISAAFGALIAVTLARDATGTLAQGNLTRQPGRSAITASATMIGLAVIVGMGGLIWSITGGFMGVLQRSLGSDYLVMPPSVALWKADVGAKESMADRLRAVPGVQVVSTMRYAASTVNGKGASLLGIDPVAYPKVASLTFQQGDARTAYQELGSGRTLIANGILAAQAGLKVGDIVRLSTPTGQKEYRVVAVAGDYLNAKVSTAYVSQANLRTDFRKTEDIFLQINLVPGVGRPAVEAKLKVVVEDYPQFKLVSGKAYFEQNQQLFQSALSVYYVLLAVLATPSLIALLNTLAIGVIERTREIGMLRAIGATQRQVRRMVIIESLLLAAIGTLFGLLGGLYLGYVMLLGLSVGGFPVSYVFPSSGLVAATAIGLIFGLLAALVPARQAAHMEIVRALRYE